MGPIVPKRRYGITILLSVKFQKSTHPMYITAEAWYHVQDRLTLMLWLCCFLTPHREAITLVWWHRVRSLLLAFGLYVISITYILLLSDFVWRDIAYEMGPRHYRIFYNQNCSIFDNLAYFYILETTVFTYQIKHSMLTRLHNIMLRPNL
jgi:hypothetical protein